MMFRDNTSAAQIHPSVDFDCRGHWGIEPVMAIHNDQATRNVDRLNILVISEAIEFLHQISFVFSPEFILQHKAKIKICPTISHAIHEVESEHYHLILMEGELSSVGGEEFSGFALSTESMSNRALIVEVEKNIDYSREISKAIIKLSR